MYIVVSDERCSRGFFMLLKEPLQWTVDSPEQTYLAFPIPRRSYGAYPMDEIPIFDIRACFQISGLLGPAKAEDIWTHQLGRQTKGNAIAIG
jgi:hypothetical protein